MRQRIEKQQATAKSPGHHPRLPCSHPNLEAKLKKKRKMIVKCKTVRLTSELVGKPSNYGHWENEDEILRPSKAGT